MKEHDKALLEAAEAGNARRCRLLIKTGADLAARSESGFTALHLAVSRVRMAAARELIEAGANPNSGDDWGATPLHLAVARQNVELMNMLIAHGADPRAINRREFASPLHSAESAEAVRILVGAGADVVARNDFGETPLHTTAKRGAVEAAKELIAAGAQVDAEDALGRTPEFFAAGMGHDQLAAFLRAAALRSRAARSPGAPGDARSPRRSRSL